MNGDEKAMSNPYSPSTHGGMPQKPMMSGRTNTLAIVSVSLGGVALAAAIPGLCCLPFTCVSILISIAALVCGFIGLAQIKSNNEKGLGLCYAGIGMGAGAILLAILFVILALVFNIAAAGNNNFRNL